MVLDHATMSLAEQLQVDPEAGIGRLGAGHRLEQQVDRRAAVEAVELGRDMSQATRLCGELERSDEAVECAEDRLGDVDRLRGRVDADHRVAAAEEQAVGGGQQDAAQVVAGVVRLDPDAQHPALAHRVAAAGDDPHLARGQDEVLVAHQLGRRRHDLRSQARPDRGQGFARRGVVEDPIAKRAHGPAAEGPEDARIERFEDQPADLIGVGIDQRMVDDLAERQLGQHQLGGDAPAFGRRGDPGELVARLLLVGRSEDRAQVGEGKPLTSDHGGQVHGSAPSAAKDVRRSLTCRAAGL